MGLTDKKTISITGGCFTDIVLYLSRVFVCLGLKPVIVDHSFMHRFYPVIPHVKGIDPLEKVLDYRGVGYTYGIEEKLVSSEEIKEADIIIKLYETDTFMPQGETSIIIADESKRYLDIIETMRLKENSMVIIRSFTGAVKRRIKEMAEKSDCGIFLFLGFDSADLKNAILAEHNDFYTFKRISAELKEVIFEMTAFIYPDFNPKRIKKACSMAEKGAKG